MLWSTELRARGRILAGRTGCSGSRSGPLAVQAGGEKAEGNRKPSLWSPREAAVTVARLEPSDHVPGPEAAGEAVWSMESVQIAQLVAFVLLVSIPLLFLEAGMRRARRQRPGRRGGG